ncbi:MAG: hypothetical protein K2J87_05680 [Muribaculaceae bacterium]|nr:hypothetical protein [Muribaculaceae bacterium]
MKSQKEDMPRWYALKTSRPVALADALEKRGVETYLPMETVKKPDGTLKKKPLVPKLLFMRNLADKACEIEREARRGESSLFPFWIYRYRNHTDIQPIGEAEFRLFRLLTADDSLRCEIYRKEEFKIGDRLRVTGGPFAGYEGYARRIRKNKHIVVEIEGLCAIALPFIHPDLLEKV